MTRFEIVKHTPEGVSFCSFTSDRDSAIAQFNLEKAQEGLFQIALYCPEKEEVVRHWKRK